MKSTYISEDEGIVYDIYIGGKVDYWELHIPMYIL